MMTLKKKDNNHVHARKEKWVLYGNSLLRHRSGAVFSACSLEQRINHVVIVLSFRAAIAVWSYARDAECDLDSDVKAGDFPS